MLEGKRSRLPKAERDRIATEKKKWESEQKKRRKIASHLEQLRFLHAQIKRDKKYQKGGRKAESQMRQELAGLREGLQITASEMVPGITVDAMSRAVRGYLYPDGRAVARLILDVPKRVNVRAWLLEVWEKGWWLFPAGTFFEANFLFPPDKDPFNGQRKDYHSKYQGQLRIQTFSTPRPQALFMTLRGMSSERNDNDFSLLGKLEEVGYKRPSQVLFRVGRSYDGSKPFKKNKPPIKKRR